MGDEQKKSVFGSEENISESSETAEIPVDSEIEKSGDDIQTEDSAAEDLKQEESGGTDQAEKKEEAGYSWDNQSRQTSPFYTQEDSEEETAVSEEQLSENGAESQETQPDSSEQAVQPKANKKKSILYPSTIITMAVVVLSIAVYLVYVSFFQSSLKGAWISTEIEEVTFDNTYLVLEDNNKAYMMLGSMRYLGSYSTDVDDEGNKQLVIDIPFALQAVFDYEFVDRNTIALSMEGDTTSYTYKNVELPASTLQLIEDFQIDSNLLGSWVEPQYNIEYTFREDGTMYINEGGYLEADCVYTIEDGIIHVEYFAGEILTMDMEYSVSGNDLSVGVMSFQKTENADGSPVETTQSEETQSTSDTAAEETTEEAAA